MKRVLILSSFLALLAAGCGDKDDSATDVMDSAVESAEQAEAVAEEAADVAGQAAEVVQGRGGRGENHGPSHLWSRHRADRGRPAADGTGIL